MLAVMRRRSFALLWTGSLISLMGSWMLLIALPVYVYQLTGSALATGGMVMARVVPDFLLGSVAGVFVDRWDRRRLLILTNVLLVLILLPLLAVRSGGWLWIVYVVAFVEACLVQFLQPAEAALLPRLVGEQHLTAANSLNGLNSNLSRLVGPALGGVVFGLTGLSGVALADAGSYLIAAVMIVFVVAPTGAQPVEPAPAAATSPWKGMLNEWLDGLRLVRGERLLFGTFVVMGVSALAEGILAVLIVPFVRHDLGGGALQFGWLMSAQAIGGILGGLVIGSVGNRIRSVYLMGLGWVLLGAFDLGIWNTPILRVDLVLIAMAGVPAAASFAGVMTLLQSAVDDGYRGRVFGALFTTMAPLTLAGMVAAGLFANGAGIVPLLNVSASLDVAAGVVALALLLQTRAVRTRKEGLPQEQAASVSSP